MRLLPLVRRSLHPSFLRGRRIPHPPECRQESRPPSCSAPSPSFPPRNNNKCRDRKTICTKTKQARRWRRVRRARTSWGRRLESCPGHPILGADTLFQRVYLLSQDVRSSGLFHIFQVYRCCERMEEKAKISVPNKKRDDRDLPHF